MPVRKPAVLERMRAVSMHRLARWKLPPFPQDFMFGVGTSDHQCEAYDPAREDIRDLWERKTGLVPRGRATDFQVRYPEDIALARDLGCRAFRFSVSWARVEPEPGRFDEEALAHYRRVVDTIVEAKMVPIVTLMHFTWPPHVEKRGGLLGHDFPAQLGAYADKLARALGPRVGYWITINEPTFLPLGYIRIWGQPDSLLPPGAGDRSNAEQLEAAARVIRQLFLAHTEARTRIREACPGAKVGANPFVLGLPDHLQDLLNLRLERRRDMEQWMRAELSGRRPPFKMRGAVDVMLASFSRTREREASVLFSDPYAMARPGFAVPADSDARAPADLAGRTIAAVRGSLSLDVAHTLGARVRMVRSLEEGVAAVRGGRCAALLSVDLLLEPLAGAPDSGLRLVFADAPEQALCAAIGPEREALLREVNAAIREVLTRHGDPRVAAFPPETPGPAATPETNEAVKEALGTARSREEEEELRALRDRGEIVVGIRADHALYTEAAGGGRKLDELETEIAREISLRLFGDPLRVRFRPVRADERVRLLRSPLARLHDWWRRVSTLFSTITNLNWWYLGMAGKLPEFLCPASCVGQLDFVGFDYYWGIPALRFDRLMRLFATFSARYSRAPVHPGGLTRLLKRYHRMFPGRDILVVENGCVETADGVDRATYLRRHLREVQAAVAARIPVKGYLCWSITTNREWGLPFGADSDFGLYRIDLDHDPALTRHPTRAAEAYRDVIRLRSVRHIPGENWERLAVATRKFMPVRPKASKRRPPGR